MASQNSLSCNNKVQTVNSYTLLSLLNLINPYPEISSHFLFGMSGGVKSSPMIVSTQS